jgi:hypothetical protein
MPDKNWKETSKAERARIQRNQQPEANTPEETQVPPLSSLIGNQAMLGILSGQPKQSSVSSFIQAKMQLDTPGDKYEVEADQVAAATVASIQRQDNTGETPTVQEEGAVQRISRIQRKGEEEELQMKPLQRKGEEEELQMKPLQREGEEEELQMKPLQREGEEEELQMKPLQREGEEEELQMKPLQREGEEEELQAKSADPYGGQVVSDDIESQINNQRGGGTSLDPQTQSQFSGAMGYDMSGVRVHTDAAADSLSRSIGAKAFTTGSDVFFTSGAYNPSSTEGQHLLGHELTHVVQQGSANPAKREGESS